VVFLCPSKLKTRLKNKLFMKDHKKPRTWTGSLDKRTKRKKEDEMNRICSTNWENRNTYRILVGKPEGKRPLGRPRLKWVDNIKMDLR
jgi:hypothetical protein